MIKFIICEDEKVLAAEYKNEIDKFMMRYDYDYKVKVFSSYNEDFNNYAKTNTDFKIYLLDIKTNEGSGLDAARMIREELNDWTSLIIIITSYNEYKYDAFGKRLVLVDFISKLDKCIDHLHKSLEICMKYYDTRPHALKFVYKKVVYNIDYREIVHIDKEQDSKKCTLHLVDNKKMTYPGTISHLMEILDSRFVKISRGTIINSDHINKFDLKENTIIFKNGDSTDSISREMKKEVIENVTSN